MPALPGTLRRCAPPCSLTPAMPDRDYSHRDIIDKLGVKPGHAVAFDEQEGPLAPELKARVLTKTGRLAASDSEPFDVVLITAHADTDAVAALQRWRPRIHPAGGIWLLTPKRKQPGYVDQNALIPAGQAAGLVDNKTCSIDDHTSAMRFVIRKKDRPT
jgi:hypothetical protein